MRSPLTGLRKLSKFPRRGRTIERSRPRTRPYLERLEDRLAPTVNVLNSFDAMSQNGPVPPDTCGAAGPNSYIETVNSSVTIYNKTTDSTIASDSMYDFLFNQGGLSSSWGLYDATMVYDEPIGRFIIGDLGNGPNYTSALNIAVSKNSNPTTLDGNSWTFYTIDTTEANESADYPGNLGYNADALVYTFNMFPTNGNGNYHNEVVALSQSSVASGSNIYGQYFDVSHWGMRPVTMHDSTSGGPMWFVSETGLDNWSGGNTIDLERIDNILGSYSVTTFAMGVNSYGSVNAPLNPDGTAITTNTQGPRIWKAAERFNDIVASQTVGVGTNEDDARWYEFNVSNPSSPYLVQQGNVGFGANTYTVYPAIDINQDGDIVMGFSKSGNDTSTDYMSTGIAGHRWSDAAGTMEGPYVIRAGDSNDYDGREGDFSGINIDPIDGTFWVADEYAHNNTWATEVTNFAMNASLSSSGGQLDVYGDQLGSNYNDYIRVDSNVYGGVTVVLDGEATIYGSGWSSIYINPEGGYNTVQIYNLPSGVPVDIDGYGFNAVTVGNPYDGVEGINSNVWTYNGYPTPSSSGYSTLTIDDSADPYGRNVGLYDNQYYGSGYNQYGYVTGLAPANIYWFDNSSGTYTGGVYYLSILGGYGGNTFTVGNTGSLQSGTYLNSGGGFNYVNVEGTTGYLNLDGGSGGQEVWVGSNGYYGGGTLANIHGNVYVNNSSPYGYSYLYIDDSGDSSGQSTNLYFDELTSTGLPAYIDWETYGSGDGGVTSLNYYGGSGFNTYYVYSTGYSPWSYFTTLNTGTGGADIYVYSTLGDLEINNEGGFDGIFVGSDGTNSDSTMQNINGYVYAYGVGATYMYLTDTGDTTGRTAYMYDGEVTGLSPANIYWSDNSSGTYTGGVYYVAIYGGSGGNSFNVENTSPLYSGTYLNSGSGFNYVNISGTTGFLTVDGGSGAQQVTVGSNGTVQGILGGVDVYNSSSTGYSYMYVYNYNDTVGRTVSMYDGAIYGLAPAVIEWSDNSPGTYQGGVYYMLVEGGSGGSTYNVYNTSPFYSETDLYTGGNDAVNVQATSGGLYIYNLGGSDTVTVGSLAPSLGGTLGNINSWVDVYGSGSTALLLDDSGDGTSRTATITNSYVTGLGNAGTISYGSDVTSLTVNGGTGGNTYYVDSTASGTTTNLSSGSGSNSVYVYATSGPLNINTTGFAFVDVGVGNMSSISGTVDVYGSGTTYLTLDDSSDSTSRTVTMNAGSVTGLSPAAVDWTASPSATGGVTYLVVYGPSAGSTFTVNNTSNFYNYTILETGGGNDTVNVLATTGGLIDFNTGGSDTTTVGNAGKVAGINGFVEVYGVGSTAMTVDDHSDTTARTATLTSNALTGLGNAGAIEYFSGVTSLTVKGSSHASTYNIQGTPSGTSVTVTGGGGNDIFNVGNSNSIGGIQGALTVQGGSGTNTLNVNDQASATGQSYTLSSTVLTPSDAASITYASLAALNINASGSDKLTLVAPAPGVTTTFNAGSGNNTVQGANVANTWTITGANTGTVGHVTFHNVGTLIGGTNNDTFTFTTNTSTLSGTVSGGGGTTNKLAYTNSNAVTVTLGSISSGSATGITGGFSGINNVAGNTNAANSLTGPNTYNFWTITGTNKGTVKTGSTTFTFSGMPHLVGGTNVDDFTLSGTSSKETTIAGGGAPSGQGDWLNYSAFGSLTTVTVNLATGAATNVSGGVTGIQNVIGGKGTNTLTGNSTGNILIGGSGSNTIVGGSGNSLLIGGSGHGTITDNGNEDILIAGTLNSTKYPLSTSAGLNAVMTLLAEMQSSDTFADKVYDLIHGTNAGDPSPHGHDLNGANKLTWGGTGPTVTPSTGSFTLNRSATATADWVFSNASSTVNGFVNGVDEHNNNTLGVF